MGSLDIIDVKKHQKRHSQSAISPFRYPGGKGFLSGYLAEHLSKLPVSGDIHFVEPFCGGAGAALNLLADGFVQQLHLNDADIRIYSAWKAMLSETDRFLDAINNASLNMEEWYQAREVVSGSDHAEYSFDLGFSTFYMNRTTHSGIVSKAGPIGGYSQTGKWKLDARFNRDGLSNRVRWLGSQASQIHITNEDALGFVDRARRRLDVRSTLFFIDPPYVRAGGRLYLNEMNEAKHIALSDILTSGKIPYWVLTYDDVQLIRMIYEDSNISQIVVNYSLREKRKECEILILPA